MHKSEVPKMGVYTRLGKERVRVRASVLSVAKRVIRIRTTRRNNALTT